MAGFQLWVKAVDAETNEPLTNANVEGVLQGFTSANGELIANVVWITITADGYDPYVEQPYTSPDMGAPILIGLHKSPPQPTPPDPTPPNPTPGIDLPELEIRGHSFQQVGGIRFTAKQCSDFNLLNRWQHGEDITPQLTQRRDHGFNMLRVWTAYDIPGIGTFLDIDYGRIPAFVDLCEEFGLYIEFCAYTGINDPAHWPQLCEAARRCSPKPLLELVNELSENTNEPDFAGRVFNLGDYSRPSGVLASRGSNGSEKPPVGAAWTPFNTDQWNYFHMSEPLPAPWDYWVMHYNDAYEWPRKVGHNSMPDSEGFGANIPCLANENTRYPDKSGHVTGLMNPSTPQAVWAQDTAAAAALLCAGSCYHSVAGKTSDLWQNGTELDCAAAWAAGAESVNLDYQDGSYRHPTEAEGDISKPDNPVLRIYDRVVGGEFARVTIRK